MWPSHKTQTNEYCPVACRGANAPPSLASAFPDSTKECLRKDKPAHVDENFFVSPSTPSRTFWNRMQDQIPGRADRLICNLVYNTNQPAQLEGRPQQDDCVLRLAGPLIETFIGAKALVPVGNNSTCSPENDLEATVFRSWLEHGSPWQNLGKKDCILCLTVVTHAPFSQGPCRITFFF